MKTDEKSNIPHPSKRISRSRARYGGKSSSSILRAIAVGLCIAAQLALYFLTWRYLFNLLFPIHAASLILATLTAADLSRRESIPEMKAPWLAVILLFPLLGSFLYLLLSRNVPSAKRRRLAKAIAEESGKYCFPIGNAPFSDADSHLNEEYPSNGENSSSNKDFERFRKAHEAMKSDKSGRSRFLTYSSGLVPYLYSDAEYYPDGAPFLDALVKALSGASSFIFMEYFTVSDGVMLDRITDVLERKAAEGVEVRLMYDDVGSLGALSGKSGERLKSKGIRSVAFNKLAPLISSSHNNRDHRKITVIDGNIAFVGGINIADEYIHERERFGFWKDCALRIEGEAVRSLTLLFLQLFSLQSGNVEDYSKYINAPLLNGVDKPYFDSSSSDSPSSSPLLNGSVSSSVNFDEDLSPSNYLKDGCGEEKYSLEESSRSDSSDNSLNARLTPSNDGSQSSSDNSNEALSSSLDDRSVNLSPDVLDGSASSSVLSSFNRSPSSSTNPDLSLNSSDDPSSSTLIEMGSPYKTPYRENSYKGLIQPFGDGPAPVYGERVSAALFTSMIEQAQNRVWIATPYFVCDAKISDALSSAVKRGVDVRVIIPGIPDKRAVFLRTLRSAERLQRRGVKVYSYSPGFIHSKILLSDNCAVCGTVNLDYRSLYHHYECAVYMKDCPAVSEIEEDLERTFEISKLTQREDLKLTPLQEAISALASAFTPLL